MILKILPAEVVLAGNAVVPVAAAAGATAEVAVAEAAAAVVVAAGACRLRCVGAGSNTVSVDLVRAFCSLGCRLRRDLLPGSRRWPAAPVVEAEWPYASVVVATAEPVAGAAIE